MAKIRSQGGKAFAYACDIADMADCDRFVAKVLAEHRHVDILINNAGRSIRRSVKFSFDRFHDFERTMQLNYFGALRLIFGFAPMMLERKAGHIINISSIGVLASPPRFSAYVASKAALDAFSWCAAPEFADANVRFTTINMPLVRTPMIAPTKLYDAFPTLSPDEAAELVMTAVIDKPKRVATSLGLAGAVAQAVAPGVSEFVLNQAYRLFPDSAAARGLERGRGRGRDGGAAEIAGGPGAQAVRAGVQRRALVTGSATAERPIPSLTWVSMETTLPSVSKETNDEGKLAIRRQRAGRPPGLLAALRVQPRLRTLQPAGRGRRQRASPNGWRCARCSTSRRPRTPNSSRRWA